VIAMMTVGALTVAGRAFAQDKALIDQGMKVYETQKCSLCHSIAGKGNVKGPLDGVGSKLTAEEIKAWMVTPREMTAKAKATRMPAMRAYTTLSDADMNAIIAYMLSLKKK